MFVKPKDLLEKLTKEEERILKSLEKRIDEFLTKEFDGSVVYIPYNDTCDKLRSNVLQNFLDRYRKVGWKIGDDRDQKEGTSYITFDYEASKWTKPRRRR